MLFTADLDNHTFTGLFYVDNGATFQKEITGNFNSGNILEAGDNYEYHLVFSVPDQYGGNYTLDFSNSLGRMEGVADGFSNYNAAFDLNADGYINGRDLAMLKAHQF